jgi:hypothetical protein
MNVKLAIAAATMATMSWMASPAITHAQDNPDDSSQTVTGCLKKGPTANTYSLNDENGKLWDVHSKTIPFAKHVGHTVTLTGTIPQKSNDQNKSDGDTAPQNRLRVTNLKMVSETCQQNQ